MASFYRRGGRYYVDVYGYGRVSLGTNGSDAATVARHIDRLWRTKRLGLPPDPESIRFLEDAGETLRKRLRKIGLIESETATSIADLVAMFEKTLDVKQSTSVTYSQSVRCLYDFFGREAAVRDVKKQDALEFRAWMLREGSLRKDKEGNPKGLARATMSRRFKTCRSIFGVAVANQLIAENPLSGIVAGRQTNGKRSFYITPALSEEIASELPDLESRLVFGLVRWLGVRVPSELMELRWTDVSWSKSSIRIQSPKTERYEGRDVRLVPIFQELQPLLSEAFEYAEDGAEFVCPHFRSLKAPGQAFTKKLKAAVKRTGNEMWPKPLINLRATRATEVDAQYGPKCESEWIGHGADVALRSYLMQTDDAWQRATGNQSATVPNRELPKRKSV